MRNVRLFFLCGEGLSDLLQLYLPPEAERAAAAASAAAAAATASPATGDATAAEDETESESDSEDEDDGGSGEYFRNLWDHKYTGQTASSNYLSCPVAPCLPLYCGEKRGS